jgi:TolB-like protein/HEAT repeat protein
MKKINIPKIVSFYSFIIIIATFQSSCSGEKEKESSSNNIKRLKKLPESVVGWSVSANSTFHNGNKDVYSPKYMNRRRFQNKSKEPTSVIRIDAVVLNKIQDELPSSFWPNANAIELLRSPEQSKNYKSIRKVYTSELIGAQNNPTNRKVRKNTQTNRRFRNNNQNNRRFRNNSQNENSVTFIDADIKPWKKYFYKVRFLNKAGEILQESGFTSCLVIGNYQFKIDTDKQGIAEVKWEIADINQNYLESPPKIAFKYDKEVLALIPLSTKHYKYPFKIQGRMPRVVLALQLDYFQDQWNSNSGQVKIRSLDNCMNFYQLKKQYPISKGKKTSKPRLKRGGTRRKRVAYINDFIKISKENMIDSFVIKFPYSKCKNFEMIRTPQRFPKISEYYWLKGKKIESPGISRNYTYKVSWTDEKNQKKSAQIAGTRPPLPTGLQAFPGDRKVKLVWDKISWNKEDWTVEPYFVLRKFRQSELTQQQRLYNFLLPGEEIFSGPLEANEYIDKDVKNGQIYFYHLEIHCIINATSWHKDLGQFKTKIPLKIHRRPGFSNFLVMAEPNPPHQLFVSLLSSPTASFKTKQIESSLATDLNALDWVQLIERQKAHLLFDETTLADLMNADLKVKKYPILSDAIIRIKERKTSRALFYDIWLEDFKNSYKKRIFSLSQQNFKIKDVSKKLQLLLRKRFPHVVNFKPNFTAKNGKQLAVAVLDFRSFSSSSNSRGDQISDLLSVELSNNAELNVIERGEIGKVMKEFTLSNLNSESYLKLGKLLLADYIITGVYDIQGENLKVFIQIVDPENGLIVHQDNFEVSFDKINLISQKLMIDLRNIRNVASQDKKIHEILQLFDSIASDNSIKQYKIPGRLETFHALNNKEKIKISKKTAYIAPTASQAFLQMGQSSLSEKNYSEALSSFQQGLKLALEEDKKNKMNPRKGRRRSLLKSDPMQFYSGICATYHAKGDYQNEIKSRKEYINFRQQKGKINDYLYYQLANAYFLKGNKKEASSILLDKAKKNYKTGQLLEEIGLLNEAKDVYLASIDNLHSYAAFIKLLRKVSPEKRVTFLTDFVRLTNNSYPYQKKAIIEELARGNKISNLDLIIAAGIEFNLKNADSGLKYLKKLKNDPKTLNSKRYLKVLTDGVTSLYKNDQPEKAVELFELFKKLEVSGQLVEYKQMRIKFLEHVLSKPPKLTKDSSLLSTAELKTLFTAPKVFNNRVFFRNGEGMLLCFDSQKQNLLWQYPLKTRQVPHAQIAYYKSSKEKSLNLPYLSSLTAVEKGVVLCSDFSSGVLHAVNAKTGRRLWRYIDLACISPPLLYQNKVIVANALGDVTELSLNSGKVLRKFVNKDCTPQNYPVLKKESDNTIGYFSTYNIFKPQHPHQMKFKFNFSLVNFQKEIEKTAFIDSAAGKEASVKELASILEGKNDENKIKFWAIVLLGKHQDKKQATTVLKKIILLDSEPNSRRGNAASALQRIAGAEALPFFQELLSKKQLNSYMRNALIHIVKKAGGVNSVNILVKQLNDPSRKVAGAAIKSLIDLKGKDAKKYFTKILQKNDALALTAALRLAKLGDKETIPVLLQVKKALDDFKTMKPILIDLCYIENKKVMDSEIVKQKILIALCQLEHKKTLDHLLRCISDEKMDNESQRTGVYVLSKTMPGLPEQKIIPALFKLYNKFGASPYYPNCKNMYKIFCSTEDKFSVPYLISLLPEKDSSYWFDNRQKSFSAGKVNLLYVRYTPAESESKEIIFALEQITGQAFGENKGAWEIWWNQQRQKKSMGRDK